MKETNMEHYRGEIETILNKEEVIAISKLDGSIFACNEEVCDKCICSDDRDNRIIPCDVTLMRWLMSEYKEEPVLTEREKHFVELVREGWIARDEKHNTLYWYSDKPTKDANEWQGACFTWQLNAQPVIHLFPFITWEDESPWAVEELRKLKVQE